MSVTKIPLQEDGISGTKTRALIANNIDEAINYFVPEELSETDKAAIKAVLEA